MPKTRTPQLVGSALAAQLLNVDRSTLTRWVKSNKITPVLTGTGKTGEMFFTRESIDNFKTAPSSDATATQLTASGEGAFLSGGAA